MLTPAPWNDSGACHASRPRRVRSRGPAWVVDPHAEAADALEAMALGPNEFIAGLVADHGPAREHRAGHRQAARPRFGRGGGTGEEVGNASHRPAAGHDRARDDLATLLRGQDGHPVVIENAGRNRSAGPPSGRQASCHRARSAGPTIRLQPAGPGAITGPDAGRAIHSAWNKMPKPYDPRSSMPKLSLTEHPGEASTRPSRSGTEGDGTSVTASGYNGGVRLWQVQACRSVRVSRPCDRAIRSHHLALLAAAACHRSMSRSCQRSLLLATPHRLAPCCCSAGTYRPRQLLLTLRPAAATFHIFSPTAGTADVRAPRRTTSPMSTCCRRQSRWPTSLRLLVELA
jgi:hypothetical protein